MRTAVLGAAVFSIPSLDTAAAELPKRYFELMKAGAHHVEARLAAGAR